MPFMTVPELADSAELPLVAHPRAGEGDGGKEGDGQGQVGIATKTRAKPKKPSQYKVLMLNDDYTPMEFVVVIIQEFFNKDRETATQIMLKIHLDGKGVCGVFSKDVAATKVDQVTEAARKHGHPLQCVSEPLEL